MNVDEYPKQQRESSVGCVIAIAIGASVFVALAYYLFG